jgi:hypothetical protein
MSRSILTNSQKKELIEKYQKEVVKLKYQLEKFEDIILELGSSSTTKTDKKLKRRGRPPKAKVVTVATEPKRRGRPPKAKVETVATEPKRRGRPAKTKVETVATEPKRRGRPPKAKVETVATEPKRRGRPAKAKVVTVATEPKRRGRPPKAKVETVATEPKRRGRPPKAKVETVATEPKRRGRPAKTKVETVATEPKRRGRPPKAKVETVATKPKRRGRPAKAKVETVATEPKRRGRPRKTVSIPRVSLAKELGSDSSKQKRKRVVTKGYKLSEWDKFILEALEKSQHALITKDFIDLSKEKSKVEKTKFDENEVKNMLNRSLHKMANKRHDIIKTKHEGKGFAYALPKWISQGSKSLKKKYKRN